MKKLMNKEKIFKLTSIWICIDICIDMKVIYRTGGSLIEPVGDYLEFSY